MRLATLRIGNDGEATNYWQFWRFSCAARHFANGRAARERPGRLPFSSEHGQQKRTGAKHLPARLRLFLDQHPINVKKFRMATRNRIAPRYANVKHDASLSEPGSGRSNNSGTCKPHIGHRKNEQPNRHRPGGSARSSNRRADVFTADINPVPCAARALTRRWSLTA